MSKTGHSDNNCFLKHISKQTFVQLPNFGPRSIMQSSHTWRKPQQAVTKEGQVTHQSICKAREWYRWRERCQKEARRKVLLSHVNGIVCILKNLKLNIQKTEIVASGPITSWQIDGETVSRLYFLGLQNHCRC